jgi:hypothetical protein
MSIPESGGTAGCERGSKSGPHAAVTGLIRDAMAVAAGNLSDIDLLDELSEQLEQLGPHIDLDDPAQREQLKGSLRLTPLDPARPALDLLEDLIYQEYAEPQGSSDEADDTEDEDAYYETRSEELMSAFIEALRTAAAQEHDRIL